MMDKWQQVASCLMRCIAMLAAVCTWQSCSIREDLSDCIPDGEWLLYVKVVDVATGQDITESSGVDEVYLYVFDPQENFVESHVLSAEQVEGRYPVLLKGYKEGWMVSAWGIQTDKVALTPDGQFSKSTDVCISLLANQEDRNYDACPDDFFFGRKRKIAAQKTGLTEEEIVITQKNAKLHVTVRGLEKEEEGYFFRIVNPCNGYNFEGHPVEKPSRLKERGSFQSNLDYVSEQPYLMIHSRNGGEEEGVRIALYKEDGNRDVEIISTTRDYQDNPIVLTPGKTTNVLMELKEGATWNVLVEVTAWNQIHQWEEY